LNKFKSKGIYLKLKASGRTESEELRLKNASEEMILKKSS